ncbi:unnamed protein product (macronuclear) [Paramecium tetraurelia]|uniref:Uncharacterized protein n=1 Tax=Paramecium tetraurelia TaxID=5888 RepID=A0CKJ1_PARTE|nr:uncharacterized protein GSPATT00001022001 [Paramecium tetraurelia]CAK71308.1 unnamed protein product [Paramecium tetraurelia]|eukprot:XP_001438705.1 hypothetical protein (macronuclear) [Paramecium tetraurelia strain d4-2]
MNENKEMIQHDYQTQLKEFYEQTQEIVSSIQQGIRIKKVKDIIQYSKDIPIQISNLMGQLKPILESISQNGEIQKYNWLHLRSLIVITTRDMLLNMQKLYPYEKTAQNEGFEDELDIVLQFLCVFEQKPPFTLQRICELLIDPQKHYKSSKKILFAMEKLVNVST